MNELIKECLSACRNVRNVFLAYNANIDAIVHVSKLNVGMKPFPKPGCVKNISSTQDLFSGLLFAMKNGEGIEIGMDPSVSKWLCKNIVPAKKRMGGQAGIMSNHLALLGARPIVYTPLLSDEQRSLFSKKVSFVPRSTANETKTNWIFEFNKGDFFLNTKAAQTNRFIASSHLDSFRLHPFKINFHLDCAILSGFQSLKRKYGDGTTYKDQINLGLDISKKIVSKGKKLHFELAYTPYRSINKGLLFLAGTADSVGLDEEDLVNALRTYGKNSLAGKIDKYRKADDIIEGMEYVAKKCSAGKIHLHGRGYYMGFCQDYHASLKHVKKSMQFASVVAAAYAQFGVNKYQDIEKGFSAPISEEGLAKNAEIGAHLGADKKEVSSGIYERDRFNVVVVPYRAAKKIIDVVGLGDIISSSIFVCETGFYLGGK